MQPNQTACSPQTPSPACFQTSTPRPCPAPCRADGAGGTGPTGAVGGIFEFAAFFGMPTGPGNSGGDDYPASISAVAIDVTPSLAGTSAINFPRASAPAIGGIVINNPGASQTDNTEFILPSVGTYRVSWHISVDEPAQWRLWISTLPSPAPGGLFNPVLASGGAPSTVGQATGTTQLVGDIVFVNDVAGSAIQVRNTVSSSGNVTVTPLPGGSQAQAVSLIIMRLA